MKKPVERLTPDDFEAHPVWEFLPETQDRDETWLSPVRKLPVDDLGGCLIGTNLRLASGQTVPAFLGNVSPQHIRKTQQFITVTVFRPDGQRFDLARYFDVDYHERGPAALAAFLGVSESEIFPISYDISESVTGLPETVSGTIPKDPQERLSMDEMMKLTFE
jgi:hypothetical protein